MIRRLQVSLRAKGARCFGHVPFEGDLEAADADLFNLQDFQHYKEAPDVAALRNPPSDKSRSDLASVCRLERPVVVESGLQNPYLNLAIEDYVYQQMPLQESDRLMFYTNSPCVVIGKNQNPWNEVNLPVLNSLKIPLLRRRSGGGTVVHDLGNVNFSYMTKKENFDRFRFVDLVCKAVNPVLQKSIRVNERGDIVTEDNLKVLGSAYKLSKGRSYHHGTMLLNLRLDVLRQLLHREERLGHVQSQSIPSVKSPVTNLGLASQEFVARVTEAFAAEQGQVSHCFVDENSHLPDDIHRTAQELQEWAWTYGTTPKFTHTFKHRDLTLVFEVKKGLVASVSLSGGEEALEAFHYLDTVLQRGDSVQYTGSAVAGFVLDDELSEWIGNCIDGTT